MKWLKRIALGLVALVVILVLVSFALPSSYRVERVATIKAPIAKVYALTGDLNEWPKWSPWIDMDPTIETTVANKATGVGAHQRWTGASGDGELTFTKADPATGVEYDMSFNKGQFKSRAGMALSKDGEGTKLTWWMTGELGMNPMARYMGVMMDKWVGKDFDRGLEKIKAAVEKG